MSRNDSGPGQEPNSPNSGDGYGDEDGSGHGGKGHELPGVEADPRFPSGPWTGFYLQKVFGATVRDWMELDLLFQVGKMNGTGRDRVGRFTIQGTYETGDGRCHFHKQYLGQHRVDYSGYNEGKGIWGTWSITLMPGHELRGGFHIWPLAMGDPTQHRLAAEQEIPLAQPVPEPALC